MTIKFSEAPELTAQEVRRRMGEAMSGYSNSNYPIEAAEKLFDLILGEQSVGEAGLVYTLRRIKCIRDGLAVFEKFLDKK